MITSTFIVRSERDRLIQKEQGEMDCSSSMLKNSFILLIIIINLLVYDSHASCTLCPYTYGVRYPSKEALPDGTTCLSVGIDGLLNALESDDSCKEYYQLIGYVRCDCAPVPIPEIEYYGGSHCSLCEDSRDVPTPSAIYDSETEITCGEVEEYLTKFDFEGSNTCLSFQQRANEKCGCSGSQTTDEEERDGSTTEVEEEDNSTVIGFESPSGQIGDNSTLIEKEYDDTVIDFEPPSGQLGDNSTEIEGEDNTTIDFEPPSGQSEDNSTKTEEEKEETKFIIEPTQSPSIQPTVDDADNLSISAATNADDEVANRIGTPYIGGIFVITLVLTIAMMTFSYRRSRKRENEKIKYTKARDLLDLNETFDSDLNEEEEVDFEGGLGYQMDLLRDGKESSIGMYYSNASARSGFSMNPSSGTISGSSGTSSNESSGVSDETIGNQSSNASTQTPLTWAISKLERFLR